MFRRRMNPYRQIPGARNADGTVAERVVPVRVGDFAELDALETGLVADVELHPVPSATH
jgi:hypothetical protein